MAPIRLGVLLSWAWIGGGVPSMGKGFRLILAVVAISICAGGVVGGDQPASAGEMTPETEKLFRAVRSNDFPAVKRNLLDGGDVRAENAAGLTVIDLAIDKGYFKIAHYLLAWRKQQKPKPKLPLPLPAPPPITAEAAPTAEPVPPEPAREVAPKAPSTVEPVSGAGMNVKPAPTPIETATKPESLPKTDPVTPPSEKVAGIPPPAPVEPGPTPTEAAATEPSDNKILTPAPAASPGILDRITGFFTSDPAPGNSGQGKDRPVQEPKAPDPKPLAEESRPAPEKAAEDKPQTPAEQAAAPSAIAAPEEEKAPEGPGVFDQIARFFSPETEPKDHSASESEAKPEPAAIGVVRDTPKLLPENTPPAKPVREAQAPAVPKTTSIEPFIGASMKLGKRWRKDAAHTCVSKPSQKRLFCIEPVDWPQEIGPSFQVHTTLYRGRKSIVRYDGEVATQFHTLFRTGNFDVIVEHFSKLLGTPTEKPVIWTVMIGKPNRKNRTVQWVRPQRAGGKNGDQGAAPGILEVREIDDLRWSSPPDDRHGVVWLYRKGGLPVFRHVSWSDFLLARVRRQGK